MSDADRFAEQDTAHDLCEVNCGQLRKGVVCPVLTKEEEPADHEPDNLWCSCRNCCCRNGMCTHGE